MPITPFHLGPGGLVKALAPRHFSFTVFAFSQALIDLEPIGFFFFTGDPVHPYLHTYLGATLVFLASWWAGPPVCRWALRAWNAWLSPAQARWLGVEPVISRTEAVTGAFIGAYSADARHWSLPLSWVRLYMMLSAWNSAHSRASGRVRTVITNHCLSAVTARLSAQLRQF